MQTDTISLLKNLVGEKGLMPVRDPTGLHIEVGFTVLSVEPPTETEDDIQRAIDKSRFTIRFDQGTLIDGKSAGVYWGSAFSKLTGVHVLGVRADEP
jgi:hypothetical protein